MPPTPVTLVELATGDRQQAAIWVHTARSCNLTGVAPSLNISCSAF
jgi:hypothetical protein